MIELQSIYLDPRPKEHDSVTSVPELGAEPTALRHTTNHDYQVV
jgi:hypothetical protein